jgi:hypothetical protein
MVATVQPFLSDPATLMAQNRPDERPAPRSEVDARLTQIK